jgi:hypothetical protein
MKQPVRYMTVPTIISAKVSPTHQGADSLARMVCPPTRVDPSATIGPGQ